VQTVQIEAMLECFLTCE